MKTPRELANGISDNFYDEVFTALKAERERADALAEALRDALSAFNNHDDYLVAGIMEHALAAYDAEAK